MPWSEASSAAPVQTSSAQDALDLVVQPSRVARWLAGIAGTLLAVGPFLLAGGLFVGGAIGMELVVGVVIEAHGSESLRYAAAQLVEEGLEMAGSIVFLTVLLDRLGRRFGAVRVRVTGLEGSVP